MVKIGDVAPDFALQTNRSENLRLSALRGRKVVLFFYPADHSTGCTRQVRALRDIHGDLAGAGVEVVGINRGDPDSHHEFAERNAVPFAIACDPGDIVRRKYGAFSWRIPGRVTYFIDEAGVVRDVFSSILRPMAHVERVRAWAGIKT